MEHLFRRKFKQLIYCQHIHVYTITRNDAILIIVT